MRFHKPLILTHLFVPLVLSAAYCAPAADPPTAPPTAAAQPLDAAAQPLDAATLAQDLTLLVRFANISLTDEQLDTLLALYKSAFNAPPAELDGRAAARSRRQAQLDLTEQEIKTLTSVRSRLIAGGMVAPHELQVAAKLIGGKRAANYLPLAGLGGGLLLQIGAVLTPEQVAELVRPQKLRARVRKQPGPLVEPVLARLTKLRDTDDGHWAAGVEDIAASAAAQAGPPEFEAYKQTYQDLKDCFARIRKMDDKQFAEGQKEILENLRALLPEGYDPAADTTVPARQQRQVLTYMFLCTRTPVLLQEMKLARAAK